MMSRLSSMVERRPLITFFVLTYALAWTFESPLVFLRNSITDTQGLVLVILASNVPSVIGIVLTAMVLGRSALRRLLGRLLIWRVEPRWYLVAVLGPIALAGGAVPPPPRRRGGGSAWGASLILGPIWGLWHLPLWLTGAPGRTVGLYAAFVVSVMALSVILTWVYNSTGGSLLLVVLLHATFNLPMTLSLEALGSQAAVPLLLYWGLLVVAASVVVIVAGPKHLSRQLRKQEERVVEPGVARPRVEPPPA